MGLASGTKRPQGNGVEREEHPHREQQQREQRRQPPPELTIRLLDERDIAEIADAFAALGWNKPASQYRDYLRDQNAGRRVVFVAFLPRNDSGVFAGYVTVVWRSEYAPFLAANIPEIQDFNVLPHLRKQGIGTALLDAAEAAIAERSPIAGIGVGLTPDYGAAQRLYVQRGYIPDGRGLTAAGEPVSYGQPLTADDDLALYFTKSLR